MNFRHNIWGYFEVTDPFEVTNEVTEIFDFQNFSRQFAHFCSSYEKASKCYEEIEMWNSGFLRDRIDYQTVSCCVVISFPQGQVIKSRVFEPKYWPLCVKKQTVMGHTKRNWGTLKEAVLSAIKRYLNRNNWTQNGISMHSGPPHS